MSLSPHAVNKALSSGLRWGPINVPEVSKYLGTYYGTSYTVRHSPNSCTKSLIGAFPDKELMSDSVRSDSEFGIELFVKKHSIEKVTLATSYPPTPGESDEYVCSKSPATCFKHSCVMDLALPSTVASLSQLHALFQSPSPDHRQAVTRPSTSAWHPLASPSTPDHLQLAGPSSPLLGACSNEA